jgi:glycosyltransferase involved in cell wall biosynthesis
LKAILISVVIPTYNRAQLIGRSIESVINQTYQKWELIVVDDGSTDNSREVVLRYCQDNNRIQFVNRVKERIKGANTCRNIGLEMAKGTLIKWLDSDDILVPDCLQKQVDEIELKGADVCFSRTGYFTQQGAEIAIQKGEWSNRLTTNDATNDLVFGNVRWQTMSGLWRKSILPNKPFEEDLMNSQEWVLNIKMSLIRNLKLCYTDEVLNYVRVHSGSMSNRVNKKAAYYYHACLARWTVLVILKEYNPIGRKKMQVYLIKKFIRSHVYMLYKGGIHYFLKLLTYYPSFLKLVLN